MWKLQKNIVSQKASPVWKDLEQTLFIKKKKQNKQQQKKKHKKNPPKNKTNKQNQPRNKTLPKTCFIVFATYKAIERVNA